MVGNVTVSGSRNNVNVIINNWKRQKTRSTDTDSEEATSLAAAGHAARKHSKLCPCPCGRVQILGCVCTVEASPQQVVGVSRCDSTDQDSWDTIKKHSSISLFCLDQSVVTLIPVVQWSWKLKAVDVREFWTHHGGHSIVVSCHES